MGTVVARNPTLLQIIDVHRCLAPHPELAWEPDGRRHDASLGGYAELATIFRQARAQNPG